MGWFDTPDPPDPIRTASAATATNVSTAVANAFLNNTNQVTPQGSLQFDQTNTYNWTDPTSGSTYSIPRFTATQMLSPQQQGIADQTIGAQTNLAGLANQQSGMLQGLLGSPYNPFQGSSGSPARNTSVFNAQAYLQAYPDVAQAALSTGQDPATFAANHYRQYGIAEGRNPGGNITIPGTAATAPAPATGDMSWLHSVPFAQSGFADVGGQQRSLGPYGSQAYGFGEGGDITRSYGPGDFSADRSKVEESLYQRMDPQLQRDRGAMEARLADQGIKIGSPAYQAAMDQFNRQLTDTRLGITQTAGQEQQRMMDMAAQRAGFQNAAQQQVYTQQLGRGQFYNQAQAQQFQEMQQAGIFANQAQQQDYQQAALRGQFANAATAQNMARNQAIFNAQNQQRGQYIQEQQALRNQPINEITALLSGSQVSQPNWISTSQNQIPTTDVAGLINNRFSQDMDAYKQQSANFNSLMGGIFGALGGVARSDRRFKDDIEKIGSVFAAGPDGEKPLPIYSFAYKDDPASTKHIGPMAQDVEKIDKSAVLKDEKGMRYLDRTKLGSILKAA